MEANLKVRLVPLNSDTFERVHSTLNKPHLQLKVKGSHTIGNICRHMRNKWSSYFAGHNDDIITLYPHPQSGYSPVNSMLQDACQSLSPPYPMSTPFRTSPPSSLTWDSSSIETVDDVARSLGVSFEDEDNAITFTYLIAPPGFIVCCNTMVDKANQDVPAINRGTQHDVEYSGRSRIMQLTMEQYQPPVSLPPFAGPGDDIPHVSLSSMFENDPLPRLQGTTGYTMSMPDTASRDLYSRTRMMTVLEDNNEMTSWGLPGQTQSHDNDMMLNTAPLPINDEFGLRADESESEELRMLSSKSGIVSLSPNSRKRSSPESARHDVNMLQNDIFRRPSEPRARPRYDETTMKSIAVTLPF